jgi:hypothetical protein
VAFTLVGESAYTVASGTGTEVKSLPGTRQDGDFVLCILAVDATVTNSSGGGGIIGASSGYTELFNPGVGDPGGSICWKQLGASPDAAITIYRHSSAVQAIALQIWRGVDAVTPIGTNMPGLTGGGSGDPDPPAYTTATDNELRVVLGFLDDDDAAAGASAPGGYTNFLAADTGQGSSTVGATALMASKPAPSAGSENPGAFSTPGSDAWGCMHMSLRPDLTVNVAAASRGFSIVALEPRVQSGVNAGATFGSYVMLGAAPSIGTAATIGLAAPVPFAISGEMLEIGTGAAIPVSDNAYTLGEFAAAVGGGGSVASPHGTFALTVNTPLAATSVDSPVPEGAFALAPNMPVVATSSEIAVPAGAFNLIGLSPTQAGEVAGVAAPAGGFGMTGLPPAVVASDTLRLYWAPSALIGMRIF